MDQKILYLLGAGASKDAGLPLASELTQLIVADINSDLKKPNTTYALKGVINYVVSTMIGHRGKSGANPEIMPDIESVVSAVELLGNRSKVELVPFIQNWDPAIELLEKKNVWNPNWARDVRDGVLSDLTHFGGKLEEGLKGFMEEHYNMGSKGDQYSKLMDELLLQLKTQLMLTDASPTQYLEPLIELGRSGKLTIATINYDLTIETVAERRGIDICRGLDNWNDEWRMHWSNSGIQLIKLHGSIDWGRGSRKNPDHQKNLLMSEEILVPMKNPASNRLLPFVVYGKREKLRPEGPFSELRSKFISELRKTSHLVVIGYSFGDEHINELIKKWLNSNLNHKIVIVSPDIPIRVVWGSDNFLQRLLTSLQRMSVGVDSRVISTRVLPIRSTAKDALLELCHGVERIDQMFNEYLEKQPK